ncbi:MAG TPA: hypothetical protein VEG27_09130 [Usitatibacter sp.]|nr:hypothetical protein [Usitatibacter sp.]
MDGSVFPLRTLAAVLCACASALPARAFTVNINPGTRAIYLQVGNGSFTGTYQGGGTPGNNATINTVSVSVSAAALGTGAAQQMSSDSTQSRSFYDNYAFCNPPVQIYIGGFFRLPGNSGTATLSVTTSAPDLVNATGDTIPFSQISWTSSGNGDAGAEPIPAGTFTGGTQTLASFPVNTWRESCHTFSYANAASVAAGTYTGRATYTLSAP